MSRQFYTLIFLFIILISGIFSCSKSLYKSVINESILFPSPPDTARIQFLTRYSNSSDIIGEPSKFKTFIAGPQDPLPIIKPYGIDINEGKLFIADAGVPGLQIIDLEENSFQYFTPSGRGKLRVPINCFIDDSNILYVTDVGRKQVVIFNQELEYIGEIGGDENFKPSDVFVVGDSIYITDPNNNKVNVYNKASHKLVFKFPENVDPGNENWLYNPLNLWITEGKIYVTDFGDSRIKSFSLKGKYIGSVGSYGTGLGQFVRPKGIAVDHEKNLYVVDAGFQNIQVFNDFFSSRFIIFSQQNYFHN